MRVPVQRCAASETPMDPVMRGQISSRLKSQNRSILNNTFQTPQLQPNPVTRKCYCERDLTVIHTFSIYLLIIPLQVGVFFLCGDNEGNSLHLNDTKHTHTHTHTHTHKSRACLEHRWRWAEQVGLRELYCDFKSTASQHWLYIGEKCYLREFHLLLQVVTASAWVRAAHVSHSPLHCTHSEDVNTKRHQR